VEAEYYPAGVRAATRRADVRTSLRDLGLSRRVFAHPPYRTCRAGGGTRSILRGLCTLILTLISALSLPAQNATIGHVTEIDEHGKWYVYADANSNQRWRLRKWQDVPAGGVIRIESPAAGAHIALVDIYLKPLIAKTCETANTCYQPIFLPLTLAGAPDELSQIYRKVFHRLLGEPYQPSMHRMRGAATRLDEGVAPLENGRVDLRKVMIHMPPGKYSLQTYGPQAATAKPSGAVNFDWNSQTTAISIGNRRPGLYEISLLEAADLDAPTSSASLRVLLCSSPQYASLLAAFERAQALTDGWGSTVSRETGHAFLRAYLAELAESRRESTQRQGPESR